MTSTTHRLNASTSKNRGTLQQSQHLFSPASSDSSAPSKIKEVKLQSKFVQHSDNDVVVDMDALQKLASQNPTALRLADMYKYAVMRDRGQRLRNAQFLHRELPIRIAQRALDLLTLPHGLNESPPIRHVALIYLRYLQLFETTLHLKLTRRRKLSKMMLTSIMLDRTSIPMDIARGIQMWQEERHADLDRKQRQGMEDAIYRFFTARVGLRLLTEHHILSSTKLSNDQKKSFRNDHLHLSNDNNLGCIQTDCNPVEQVELIAKDVIQHTTSIYGVCPEIDIVSSGEENKFTYVPHHLQYMMTELLKNSCRATIRHCAGGELHPIRVVIVIGAEDVSIKVADRGGGVPRSTMKEIFKFAHSTKSKSDVPAGSDDIRGFGLPLCRIYARYFGGELTLKSMEGYGLDAYLYLPRLGDACENLPPTVKASPGGQISLPT
ncbi:Mitochondrial branched-chain alpha-ketoacid dehydrogenase kinase [Fragilaria crotonensis]|nr:Mitochondrial branched-chain alpha-ketoacid dehydrogenase kinase [Fragilaria crotonensis]